MRATPQGGPQTGEPGASASLGSPSTHHWSYPNAVTKRSVSVVINVRCGDNVCLCSMDFVFVSNNENLTNAVHSRNRFTGTSCALPLHIFPISLYVYLGSH